MAEPTLESYFEGDQSDLTNLPVHATFLLYGRQEQATPAQVPLNRLPTISMRCRLEMVPHPYLSSYDTLPFSGYHRISAVPPLRYRLPSSFARLLREQTRDMDVAFLQIHIYAPYEGIVFDMAHMHHVVYPFPNDFEPRVEPASDSISFGGNSSNADAACDITQFMYTPSQTTVFAILSMLSM
jgi:hypothetical protein